MKESQTLEFKSVWRDEFLKHICAFANTQGGRLLIGIDDHGHVVGLNDVAKLLEDIPNKAISYLGIIVDLHLHEKEGKSYLEIVIPTSSTPISYKGVYYIKSGSTKQELKGEALQHFILKKMGRTYDELPADYARISDIDEKPLRRFLHKAIIANRLLPNAGGDETEVILSNLKLITHDRALKNAALLLFGKDPQSYFVSSSFRIGRFGASDHDLRSQDVIEGNIFEMPDKVIEILRTKYLISPIRYEGLQRIEELEYPEDALREAILNAIIHKDYTGAHIQLSIYDEKIILWNPGKLPDEIKLDQLIGKHPSIPRNRLIADIFFKAGYIEAWGRGIDKIRHGFTNA
jgi:ATP-dependent DNA helicase RecG